MNNRERFFNLLNDKEIDRTLFFPDITTWYENSRKNIGDEEIFGPGVYIPDGIDFHKRKSNLNNQFSSLTFLDYYRKYDWGLPVHIYDWYREEYTNGVEKISKREGRRKYIKFKTRIGEISRTLTMGAEGSWVPTKFFVQEYSDLKILKEVFKNREIIPDYSNIKRFLKETQGFGVCDVVIWRSPFGKLVHEFMGFEEVVYGLHDPEKKKIILDFLDFLKMHDLNVIKCAAKSPAKIVIISDHADETLISPRQYEQYCIPYYQEACKILHDHNMYVSTHLDGNFKHYFPILHDTHFDLLDGCTPAPMFNYKVEELADLVNDDLHAYCGVPSTLFTQELPTQKLVDFGLRIAKSFNRKVIVNIGDILPPRGDINQVIEVGKAIMDY
ncbi:MAG: hypothetical protein KGY44_07080 [Halanaerobiales bacterium]|nr:hypothetical protein [Halanaerobiales bacterium]